MMSIPNTHYAALDVTPGDAQHGIPAEARILIYDVSAEDTSDVDWHIIPGVTHDQPVEILVLSEGEGMVKALERAGWRSVMDASGPPRGCVADDPQRSGQAHWVERV